MKYCQRCLRVLTPLRVYLMHDTPVDQKLREDWDYILCGRCRQQLNEEEYGKIVKKMQELRETIDEVFKGKIIWIKGQLVNGLGNYG